MNSQNSSCQDILANLTPCYKDPKGPDGCVTHRHTNYNKMASNKKKAMNRTNEETIHPPGRKIGSQESNWKDSYSYVHPQHQGRIPLQETQGGGT